MVAKGRDASDLFPAVVKNVVSKNIEVKKLVYVYLVRYAEEQQDLALLSISTFQRALKDPNQLIRASALRVLSSIRVNMIVPIVMLAIRDSSSDMSPYVRKTAAHAIPKLYSLDPEQKEELVTIIDKLLSDKSPLVVGSAAMAFMEVCPEQMEHIHRSYRRICTMLVDVDEWGQLVLLNMLTIYAKTFFVDPNEDAKTAGSDDEKSFYDDSDSDSSTADKSNTKKQRSSSSPTLDPDHKMLLRAARPLLQSRNSGVVMAVAQLYFHCAPASDLPPVAKAMVRLLRSALEVQSVVLHSIASLTISKRSLFEPFLKSFFVRTSDSTHIKLLKLEVLTNLATETSAPVVLREFQTYVTSSDKTFGAATIQAIGRLAATIESVTETCINGLLQLLSSIENEWVACEAVVVVKRVVSCGASSAQAAVAKAIKLVEFRIVGGNALAAAIWLIAEHGASKPRSVPILACMVENFDEEDELVKLQLLTLAVKLSIAQPEVLPLAQYVLTLARYDNSYDVRDRARMLRKFIDPEEREKSRLLKHAAEIFLAEKPAPVMESKFKDRQQYTLGTLSHYVGHKTSGYIPLPDSPANNLGADLRESTPTHVAPVESAVVRQRKDKSFYSDAESSGPSTSGTSEDDTSSSEDSTEEDSGDEEKAPEKKIVNKRNTYKSSNSGTSDSEWDSSSSGSDESDTDDSDDTQEKAKSTNKEPNKQEIVTKTEPEVAAKADNRKNEKSNLELLLELDDVASSLPTMTPTCGGFLSPSTFVPGDGDIPTSAMYVEEIGEELLSRVCANGLSCQRRWIRAPHLYSNKMVAIELVFTNHTQDDVTNIRLHKKTLSGTRSVHDFAPISSLSPGDSAATTLGVDFADTIQPFEFTIMSSLGVSSASITPPIGELIRSVTMSEGKWDIEQKKLRGMTECEKKTDCPGSEEIILERVYRTANMSLVSTTGDFYKFIGRLMSSGEAVLLSVQVQQSGALIKSNCSNMAVASLLTNQLAKIFSN